MAEMASGMLTGWADSITDDELTNYLKEMQAIVTVILEG